MVSGIAWLRGCALLLALLASSASAEAANFPKLDGSFWAIIAHLPNGTMKNQGVLVLGTTDTTTGVLSGSTFNGAPVKARLVGTAVEGYRLIGETNLPTSSPK